ncbi:hypothetical protein QE152_g30969 [Popillia japonica]|uniref:Uncharacterized protein n=1 Tax=Popillia japonica TaxID=7064 RepID=A0AAW1JCP9_POPJA
MANLRWVSLSRRPPLLLSEPNIENGGGEEVGAPRYRGCNNAGTMKKERGGEGRPNQIRNGPKRYKRRKVTDNRDYKVLYRFTKENVEWITYYFYGNDNLDITGEQAELYPMKLK